MKNLLQAGCFGHQKNRTVIWIHDPNHEDGKEKKLNVFGMFQGKSTGNHGFPVKYGVYLVFL
jgi:hypothetical protein